MFKKTIVMAVLSLTVATGAAQARDQIRVVGSSTVFPFATAVAERFGKSTSFKTPVIESTGSGGGLKLFCAGTGLEHPDITNASRRIKKSEVETCEKNGVTDIVEVKIGYDGIVIANAKAAPQYKFSRKDLYLALAKFVPDAQGNIVENSARTWKDVNASLPAVKIEVLGPPPTSGTRDAFVELVMEEGCGQIATVKALKSSDKGRFKEVCQTIREDGAYIEAGENDNLIVQKLEANHDALGIFGFSFLDQNTDMLKGSLVDGVAPEFAAIADGSYPVSRPLFFYVKKSRVGVVPGIAEYLAEFSSEKAWGPDGYLADKGLIPMPDAERKEWADKVARLVPLSL